MMNCDFDPSAITLDQAQEVILAATETVQETECIDLHLSLGRVLRSDVISPVNNPPTDNSAMDGYAVLADDCQQANVQLNVVGQAFAGAPFAGILQRGQAVRIMTGASIPDGATAVVMQEKTTLDSKNHVVTIHDSVSSGENIRLKGEDISIGQTVLLAGTYLTPACIGVLATMGIAQVEVSRQIKVAILSTGDELQPLGTNLKSGNIYDSNRYVLQALLTDPRINVLDYGILVDDKDLIQSTMQTVADTADMVITTGGVSVGEADWIKDCVKQIGELIFWKAAIKPGRPITFGRMGRGGKTLFFGLPGNPVSVMVTFEQFVRLGLQALAGQKQQQSLILSAKLMSNLKKRPGRTEFQRGILFYDEKQQLCVRTTGDQGSGILSSMVTANALIILDSAETSKYVGEMVSVQPLSTFLYVIPPF